MNTNERMTTTWANPRKILNAYHDLEYDKPIYDNNNKYVGMRGSYSARCTAKSPGSVTIVDGKTEKWYSGPIKQWCDGYKLINEY